MSVDAIRPPIDTDADASDRDTAELVRPSHWINPEPRSIYDLVVLGGGTAGLVSAMGAAGLGARVALVERRRLGGDCLNVGCVPSKALLRSARAVGEVRRAPSLGVDVGPVAVDFAAVMSRMRRRRAALAPHDSAERIRTAGVDLFFGDARFIDACHVQVEGARLRFRRAVVATGGRPAIPPIEGLELLPFLTNETVFSLTELPARLLVIGAGAIGCELAQAFARFGARVTVLDQAPRVLPGEEADASAIVQRRLAADGVTLHLGARLLRAHSGADDVRIDFESGGRQQCAIGERILVAAGRTPNVEDIGLDAAGVARTSQGIVVDDRLRTANRRIYAAGDVCSRFKFTHAADAMARIVIQNALFYGRRRASALVIPRCTYTDPEVAHVGLGDAPAHADAGDTITIPLAEIDRAVLDDEIDGFVRVRHSRGRLLGVTIVAAHAGEIAGEAALALQVGASLADLSATIHPYPTQAEALRRAGDAYRRTALTPATLRWLRRYFRWTRR